MTNLEKQFLTALVNERRQVSVHGSTWDEHGHHEHTAPQEAARLLKSDDYVLGWEACHRSFHEGLSALVRGEITSKDMKRFIGQSKQKR